MEYLFAVVPDSFPEPNEESSVLIVREVTGPIATRVFPADSGQARQP